MVGGATSSSGGAADPVPTLSVVTGRLRGTVIPIDEPSGTVGRRTDNAYVLPAPCVSRVHARLTRAAAAVYVTDLGSTGGTRVNGVPVGTPNLLEHADQIAFGGVRAVFDDPAGPPTADQITEDFASPVGLSRRQRQVLCLMAEGLTNPEIARELAISESTVKDYSTTVYDRLEVTNRAGAVAAAVRLGLL